MRSLIACGIALGLIALSAKFSPALALIVAIFAEGLGLDGMAVLTFLWS
jgi:hypothetical protein